MRRAASITLLVVLAPAGLTACGSSSGDTINKQAKQGDDKGYIAGDGTIQQLAPGKRGKPVLLDGTTLDNKKWSVTDVKDKVIVLNVWGSWCMPCQTEVPHLEQAWKSWQSANKPVVLMGLAQRDPSDDNARTALKRWGATYPSLKDDGGRGLLQLQGKVVATPTTLVLDREHRIAARVSGAVTTTTLEDLVDTVVAEKS